MEKRDSDGRDNLVPAFETAVGIKTQEPILVDKDALEYVNREVKPIQRYANDAANIAALYAKKAVRPDEIAALRRQMFDVIQRNLPVVEDVIQGKKEWKSSQVRLYALLTERVIPKMSSISIEDSAPKKVEDLSIEELEALALGKRKNEAIEAVLVEGERQEKIEYKEESKATERELIRALAKSDAVDEAERAYVTKLVSKREAQEEREQMPKGKTRPWLRNGRSLEEIWREKGFSEEEIAQKTQEMIEKRKRTKQINKAKKGYALGLDYDQEGIAKEIKERKNKSLRNFRVHGNKGVRSQTAIVKQKEKRERVEARRKEYEENPKILTGTKYLGMGWTPKDQRKTITLRELKEMKPEIFSPDKEELKRQAHDAYLRWNKKGKYAEQESDNGDNPSGSGEVSPEDQESLD